MSDEKVTLFYGVWIPGDGWLKGKENKPFADYSFDKASQVSRCIGRNSVVRFIDESIVDFERHYLEQERRSPWHIFKNLFENSKDKSISKG